MKKTVCALMAMGLISSANASTPIDGLYGSVFGGYTYIVNNISRVNAAVLRDSVAYNDGFNGGIRFGYQGYPLRYEAEYTYIQGKTSNFNVNNLRQVGVTGDTVSNLIMGNVYYDTPEMLPCIMPFLGVGIGYANVSATLNSTGPNGITRFKASDGLFAYQVITGLTYNFAENWAANLGYRYVATDSSDTLGKLAQYHIASAGVVYRFDEANYK